MKQVYFQGFGNEANNVIYTGYKEQTQTFYTVLTAKIICDHLNKLQPGHQIFRVETPTGDAFCIGFEKERIILPKTNGIVIPASHKG